MGFIDAIKFGFGNYVTFPGRAARSEYWYWTLFTVIATIVAEIVDGITGLGILSTVVSLGLFLPSLAVAVRRLHDIDRTGWWILIAFTIIDIILLIVWDCIKGTTGPNRYGPDPLPPV